jgi:hypothetical protein
VVASYFWFGGTLIIAVMIMISTLPVTTDWLWREPECIIRWRKMVFFKKAAELNQASVPEWSIWAQCIWASALCLTEIWWFIGFCGDHRFDIYPYYFRNFILRKKMPNVERPYKAFDIHFTCTLHNHCWRFVLRYCTLKQVRAAGVWWLCSLGFQCIIWRKQRSRFLIMNYELRMLNRIF